jgi:hypothetical protein
VPGLSAKPAAYSALKERLAVQLRHDRDAQIEGKRELVERVLAQAAAAC